MVDPELASLKRLSPGLLELAKVVECLARVPAEDGFADEPEERSEDAAARARRELASPDHLHPTAGVRGRRAQLPAAARWGVDVGAGDRRLDRAWLRPVVVASLPVDPDSGWRAFGDVGPVVAKVMNLEMLDPDRREDLGSS